MARAARQTTIEEDTHDDLAPQTGVHLEYAFCPNPELAWPDNSSLQEHCKRVTRALIQAGLLTEKRSLAFPGRKEYVTVYESFRSVEAARAAGEMAAASGVPDLLVRENGKVCWKAPEQA